MGAVWVYERGGEAADGGVVCAAVGGPSGRPSPSATPAAEGVAPRSGACSPTRGRICRTP